MVKWRIDSLYKGISAEKVRDELLTLGDFTPKDIVGLARDETTELHKCFEWNDTVAAEKYRLYQARNIAVNLVISRDDKSTTPIRVFSKSSNEVPYKETVKILQNQSEYEQLLKRAYYELQIFKSKYSSLSELDFILDLIP